MSLHLDGASRGSYAAAYGDLSARLVAEPTADRSALAAELAGVADLLGRNGRLLRALSNPGQEEGRREALAASVFGGTLSPIALSVVTTLVRARWRQAADVPLTLEQLSSVSRLAAAEQAGRLDDVEDELFRFSRTVEREPRLLLALSDPALPEQRKIGLLDALLTGKVSPETDLLVRRAVLAPFGRPLLAALNDLSELAAQRRERLIARARVARPLDAERTERLRAALSTTYGRPVQLEVDVDPGLIGGIVIRVGDEVIDASIVHRLAQVRAGMAGR